MGLIKGTYKAGPIVKKILAFTLFFGFVSHGWGISTAEAGRLTSVLTLLKTCSAALTSPQESIAMLLSTPTGMRLQASPTSLRRLKELVDFEFKPETLEQNLHAFYGFHHFVDAQGKTLRPYNMRPWNGVSLKSIGPEQIQGMSLEDFLAVLQVAMEIEDPIMGYQAESGKAFEFILPKLARFMGRNPQQQALAEQENRQRLCESPWCAEESRHGEIYARLLERLTGRQPNREQAAIPTITASTEEGGLRHLSHRQGTEWGASAAYLLLAIHSTGPLKDVILNVLRDEIKHLVVVSAADVYLRGHVANERTARIAEKTYIELIEGPKARTGGNSTFLNPLNLAEGLAGHILMEVKMRSFLSSLPLNVLRDVFESPSDAITPRGLALEGNARAVNEYSLKIQAARGGNS